MKPNFLPPLRSLPPRLLPALAALAGLCLLTPPVLADGGSAMPRQILPAYQQECAACHLAYPPGMLPAPSWKRIMGGLEHHYGTDASLDEASVRQRLQRFEAWLRPLRSQFALGARLVEQLRHFKDGVVHVLHEGRLLAVIDLDRWQTGLFIPARPVDVAMAEWVRRPHLAGDIPPSFMRLPLHRVLWTYTVRTRRDLLPERYREQTVHLRRVPRLPPRWFDETHLLLMRELMAQPARLDELVARTGQPVGVLARHLAALYYAGGVTTDADSARRAAADTRRAVLALQFDQADLAQDAQAREGRPSEQAAPSSLLREVRHSPLRAAQSDGADQHPV